MRVRLRFYGRVPADVRGWLRYATKNLRASSVLQGEIDVMCFALTSLPAPAGVRVARVKRDPKDGEFCAPRGGMFGWFAEKEIVRSGRPMIALAGRVPAQAGRDAPARCGHILHTFAHELVHYAQASNGQKTHHRGIESATMRMLRIIAPDGEVLR